MKKVTFFYIFLLISIVSFGQTLDKRWQQMVDRSNSYNAHKIIKREELNNMWSSVQDSLLAQRLKVKQEQKRVNSQVEEIASLNQKIKASNDRYNAVVLERDEAIDKANSNGTYILTLWIALGIVSLICAVLYFLYNKSNALTQQKTNDYELLHKSFEEYKVGKLEVERKLKREIQTYMNTVEEMKVKRV